MRRHRYISLMTFILAIITLAACTGSPIISSTPPTQPMAVPTVTITSVSVTLISPTATLEPLVATPILPTATGSTAITTPVAEARKEIVFETDALRLELASNGRIQGIVDITTGVNHIQYLDSVGLLFPFMAAVYENQSLYPTAMWLENDQLIATFGTTSQLTIALRVKHFSHFLTFEVLEFQGPLASPIRFVQLPVNLSEVKTIDGCVNGVGNAGFAVYVLALNNQAKVYADARRGQGVIAANVWQPSEIRGAKVAVFGAPPSQAANIAREIFGEKALFCK